ncbi:MAG: ABC transporter ATP-binding protein [Acidimicrobiaceae bacterium]|nr:ABC transporter ATP-binding protein [Acidimicrobiaceae bacterium]
MVAVPLPRIVARADGLRLLSARRGTARGARRHQRRAVLPVAPLGPEVILVSALELDGFALSVGGEALVNEVSLELAAGRTHAVIGERGSSKTVLLRSLVGMWPENAEVSGRLRADGLDLVSLTARERLAARRERLMYLPPSGREALNPVERVDRHFLDVCSVRAGWARARRRRRRESLLAEAAVDLTKLGIADPDRVLASIPDELSGGMRKRVLIAMALLLKPAVLAADDPTSGLDVTISRQILDLLAELQGNEGFTLVIATQDLGIVAHYASTITVLKSGTVVEHTDPATFFAGPASETGAAMLARARV